MSNFFRLFFFFFFITQYSFAQLSNFTLAVTKTNETCTGNGSLSFNVQNTAPGATIIYSIYLLPDIVSPLAVMTDNTLTGLVAGNYRVIATQSLGNQSNTQQQDVVITSQIATLTYQISGNNLVCGVDGTITVNILSGIGVSYEIFSGPIIRPLQTSNVFTGLIAGTYQIRVFDSCGEGIAQTFVVFNATSAQIAITSNNNFTATNCNSVSVVQTLSAINSLPVAYPLNVQYSVFPPFGAPALIFNQTLNFLGNITQQIPLYPNQYYTYNVRVTDACGNVFNDNGNVVNSSTQPRLFLSSIDCTQGSHYFAFAQSVTLTSAPSTYTNPIPFNYPESDNPGVFLLNNLPNGNYSFTVVDICGVSQVLYYYLSPYSLNNNQTFVRPGCEVGFGSIRIKSSVSYQSVFITYAPTSYPNSLPDDVSANLDTSSLNFYMNSLPDGFYIFKTIDSCGLESEVYEYIYGYQENTDVSINQNCNSFDINLNHNSNTTFSTYWLQKYDSVLNKWVHPITGVVYDGIVGLINSISLINNTVNYNFTTSGNFRILINKFSYGNGVQYEHCTETLYEFEYFSEPKVNNVYSFACANNTYDVLVDASGIAPLIYRITTKNGNPFLIQNGVSSVFLGLEPATYNFQVEDSCGNIFNRLFDVPTPFNLEITPSNLCDGQTAVLSTHLFPFLDYQWWKDNDASTILSTTNSLSLSSFDFTTDSGVYHVRIRYSSNPNSCIDFTINYTVSSNNPNPNAGQGGNFSYCGTQNTVDLNSLLQGTFDTNGVWTETSSSGTLSANLWNSTNVAFGTYSFTYRVDGNCNLFDEAIINITLKEIPDVPTASSDAIICETKELNLYATSISNGTYNWVGPNGFSSSEQNPVIENISSANNGIYTVNVVLNDCPSEVSSIEIFVNELPEFELFQNCINSEYVLSYEIQNNDAVLETDYDFSWFGPSNFSSIESQVTITRSETGIYGLTITDLNGCSATKEIDVIRTICEIPNVITPNNDGSNDSFDLTGFGVKKIEIYNRWGRLVYDKENYSNEWHGQNNNGESLPDSTYYYLIQMENEASTKVGWIYVTKG